MPAIVLLGFWFLMQLFSAGAVASMAKRGQRRRGVCAHVAGFVVGMVGVFVFRRRQRSARGMVSGTISARR